MNVGDPVVLVTPGNPHLDGVRGVVKSLAPWGYIVSTPVGSGEFRAFPEEVELERVGTAYQAVAETPVDLKYAASREQGYSGDVCPVCQGSRMRRNGSCLVCEQCGSTSGCS